MTAIAQWSALVGSLMPLLVAFVNRQHWGRDAKAVVSVIACVAAALVTAWVEGKFNTHSILTSVIWVYASAQITYRNFWAPTGIAPRLEAATTPKRRS